MFPRLSRLFAIVALCACLAPAFAAEPVPVQFGYQPTHKFGRVPSKPADIARTLKLRHYLAKDLPAPPDSVNWSTKVAAWPADLWGNSQYGDCTVAGACSIILCQTSCNAAPSMIDTGVAEAFYFALTGGSDSGLDLVTVLSAMQNTGIQSVGGKVDKWGGYVSVDVNNPTEIEQAVNLFGGCYIGISLPRAWDQDTSTWTVSGANTMSVGGHCVTILGYDQKYWYIYTWSQIVPTERAALPMVCDEIYAGLNADWVSVGNAAQSGLAPVGLDVATLSADIQAMGTPVGPLPVPPTPIPTPPAPPTPDPVPPTPVPPQPTPAPPVITAGTVDVPGGSYTIVLQPANSSKRKKNASVYSTAP